MVSSSEVVAVASSVNLSFELQMVQRRWVGRGGGAPLPAGVVNLVRPQGLLGRPPLAWSGGPSISVFCFLLFSLL